MFRAKRENPKNNPLINPLTDGNKTKVESPTTPTQSAAKVIRAFLNGGRKNRDE
jgi:hypothetical protein